MGLNLTKLDLKLNNNYAKTEKKLNLNWTKIRLNPVQNWTKSWATTRQKVDQNRNKLGINLD